MECTRSADEPTGRDSASTSENSMQRRDPVLSKYKFLETIGIGGYSKVKLATYEPTGEKVAIKIVDKTQLTPDSIRKVYREARIMGMLDHPNIVKLFHVFETENTFYMVMEYASGGEFFEYLERYGKMGETEARAKFRQIVSAVEYCHKKMVVHRDLKDTNILLDSDLNIKITDFGFSTEFKPGNKLSTFCGSPQFAAPEIFLGTKYDGPEVDVWSLGVILFTLVTGNLPFNGLTIPELRIQVLAGKYEVPSYVSKDCENILKTLLVIDRSKRANLEIIRKDKWLNMEN